MLKIQDIVIDGDTYSVTQLPARAAMKLFYSVMGYIGPALGKLGGLEGVDISAIGIIIETLTVKCSADDFDRITRELLASLTKNGAPLERTFDLVLAGQMLTIMKLVRFAFEVNFGDFFDAARGAMAKTAAQKTPPKSLS